ncbi:MAG: dipeptidase, partial [Burkholderiales bacterium]
MARKFLERHPLIDGHNDLPNVIREKGKPPRDVAAYDLRGRTAGDTDLGRLREGGIGGQFWSVWIPSTPEVGAKGFARIQLEQIDLALRMIERYPDALALALTAGDIERANGAGRIASLLGIEGGHAIENSLGALRDYWRLGVRYMTLTHFNGNDWADSATAAPRHGGLTKFGEEVVREMNRLGMLVDLSHVSEETMSDALDVAEAPVIFSHSSARALTNHVRNVPDSILRRVTANGGVVMVNFAPQFISEEVRLHGQAVQRRADSLRGAGVAPDAVRDSVRAWNAAAPRATLRQVADHIEHIRRVAGVDHVGIGSDFDGIPRGPLGLEDVADFPV